MWFNFFIKAYFVHVFRPSTGADVVVIAAVESALMLQRTVVVIFFDFRVRSCDSRMTHFFNESFIGSVGAVRSVRQRAIEVGLNEDLLCVL